MFGFWLAAATEAGNGFSTGVGVGVAAAGAGAVSETVELALLLRSFSSSILTNNPSIIESPRGGSGVGDGTGAGVVLALAMARKFDELQGGEDFGE